MQCSEVEYCAVVQYFLYPVPSVPSGPNIHIVQQLLFLGEFLYLLGEQLELVSYSQFFFFDNQPNL